MYKNLSLIKDQEILAISGIENIVINFKVSGEKASLRKT